MASLERSIAMSRYEVTQKTEKPYGQVQPLQLQKGLAMAEELL